ncbi:hypothetical protein [Xanthomonas sp. D-36-1]|uniref:hypothetical protein n=1 Tax=Xanthomonas sp. D-36-1 TaxID=2821271 RepID=UPI001ADCA266|nr:hypothetical protein [Xanthomonas sp. D-36-1]MBO9892099.1 hypothetical protein [Xanthomonas sp. D-36-1]
MDEKIEVGYRNIGAALGKEYHHKFLLYTDKEGNQRTIREGLINSPQMRDTIALCRGFIHAADVR